MLGKLCTVGTAIGVAPALLNPMQEAIKRHSWYFDTKSGNLYCWQDGKWLVVATADKPAYALAS